MTADHTPVGTPAGTPHGTPPAGRWRQARRRSSNEAMARAAHDIRSVVDCPPSPPLRDASPTPRPSMEQSKAQRRRSSLGTSLRSLLGGSFKRRNSCHDDADDDDADDLEFPRPRRSSTIGSDQTRDSFEVMVRRSSHGNDDADHNPDAIRQGSLYRPRKDIDLEGLALSSSSSVVVHRRSVVDNDDDGQEDTKEDDDVPDDHDDDAHIQRLVECLRITQEGSTARRASADDANATATIFARLQTQQHDNKKTSAFRHRRRRRRSNSTLF